MHKLNSFLNSFPVFLIDGALGTELQRREYKTSLPLWSSAANHDAESLVKSIHEDYIEAGADAIVTNTFRSQIYTYEKANRRKDEAIISTKKAVKAAKEAQRKARKDVFIGGGLAPLEDCYEPGNVPEDEVLIKDHKFQAELLAELGVDFLICETFNCIREAEIVSKACKSTNLPFFLSFVPDKEGNLLSGESLSTGIEVIAKYDPLAILLNCRPIDDMEKAANILLDEFEGNKGIYANGIGNPDDDLGWNFQGNEKIDKFIETNKNWHNQGFKIIGGCCGTSPEYIKMLKSNL